MDTLIWVLGGAVLTIGLLYVHEMGHYLYGQLFAGIPANRIRLVMWASPPHVALEADGRFLSPDEPGYVDAFRTHAPGAGQAIGFIASGYLLQIAATIGVVSAMTSLGLDDGLAFLVVLVTALVTTLVLALEAVGTLRAKAPAGDIGALWMLSRPAAVGLVAVVLGTYLVLLRTTQ